MASEESLILRDYSFNIMKSTIVHIGLHKTGTTYLQNQLLPSIPRVKVHRGFETHRSLLSVSEDDCLVISDESISGSLWGGKYGEDFYRNMDKIKSIYNNPKIIIGIREQSAFLQSIYKQFLHEKGRDEFSYLYNLDDTGLLHLDEMYLMPKLNYLLNNFEDVFIYSQESLRDRKNDFIKALISFMEISDDFDFSKTGVGRSNVGVESVFQVNLLRKLNTINNKLEALHPSISLYSRLFKKLKMTPRHISQNLARRMPSKKFSIDNEVLLSIKEMYSKDWSEASSLISY